MRAGRWAANWALGRCACVPGPCPRHRQHLRRRRRRVGSLSSQTQGLERPHGWDDLLLDCNEADGSGSALDLRALWLMWVSREIQHWTAAGPRLPAHSTGEGNEEEGVGQGVGQRGAQGNGGIADGEQEAHSRAATTRAFRDWLDAWTGNSTGPVLGPEVTTLCGSGREQGRERSRRVRRRLVDDNDWIVDDDEEDDIRDFDDDEEDGEGREEVPNVLILRGPSGTPCH